MAGIDQLDRLDLAEAVREAFRNFELSSHAAHVIYVASNLEEGVERVIVIHMPNLSNKLKEQLFRGYGPLSSFSAKIDIAFALGLIPDSLRRDLHTLRQLRNAFAHAKERITLESPRVEPLLRKFSGYVVDCSRVAFLRSKLLSCYEILAPIIRDRAPQTPSPRKLHGDAQAAGDQSP